MYAPKYNGNTEGGLSSKKYKKATRHFYGVFKKETDFSSCLSELSRKAT